MNVYFMNIFKIQQNTCTQPSPLSIHVCEREKGREKEVCVQETISKIVNVREAKTQPNCKNNQGVVQIMLTYPTIHMY